jgi:N,N'-diacetyllegionaminate synthase
MRDPVLIIAEAGVNHNDSLALAKRMADAAKEAGADVVKYQAFVPERLVSASAGMADYQKQNVGRAESQLEMLSRLALSFDEFRELKAYCDGIGIRFLATPFDAESIEFLKTLDPTVWKIPSGEVTNVPYLLRLAATGQPLLLSTGMCDEDDVAFAVDLLREHGAGEITLLHCNTEYPTPLEDANLSAITALRERFGCPVGYSDHTLGIEAPVAAVALGAEVIEKHFTLDKKMEGPDHRASLDPEELRCMVTAIRRIETALGEEAIRVSPSERRNMTAARKSIVAKRFIRKGQILAEDDLCCKRPGDGISPREWFSVIGKQAVCDFAPDEQIRF